MIFNISIDVEMCETIALRNNLERWQSEKTIEYATTELSKINGVFITIKKDKQKENKYTLKLKCSLHKVYNKLVYCILENDNLFSITEAKRALYTIFSNVGIEDTNARITYFEIGLNIPTERNPLEYIELAKGIQTQRGEKEMFIDANYKRDRQKTTEKHNTIKKFFKMYDKGFEKAKRTRTEQTDEKTLRIETVYRRQSIYVNDFFSNAHIDKLTNTFLKDWESLEFERKLTSDKGITENQKRNAERILTLGRDEYLQEIKTAFDNKELTAKQYRTVREFLRDWDTNKHKYRMLPTEDELEFKQKLSNIFNYVNK